MAPVVIAIAHKHTFRVKEKSILASRAVFANHLPRIRILNGNNGSSGCVCGRGEEGVCHHFIFFSYIFSFVTFCDTGLFSPCRHRLTLYL